MIWSSLRVHQPDGQQINPDLVNRQFTAAKPNQFWSGGVGRREFLPTVSAGYRNPFLQMSLGYARGGSGGPGKHEILRLDNLEIEKMTWLLIVLIVVALVGLIWSLASRLGQGYTAKPKEAAKQKLLKKPYDP